MIRGTDQATGDGFQIVLFGKVRGATKPLARCNKYNPASSPKGIAKVGD